MRKLGLLVATAIGAMGMLAPAVARAHFRLTAPPPNLNQNTMGDPQKSAPCGQADMGATPNTTVTPFTAGQTVTITLNETLFHPGHFRVALSTTGNAGLPPDPTVTPTATDDCASTTIMTPPTYPVLADGMLQHTTMLAGAQSIQVTLPSNVTCTSNCVLQVIQYMSRHDAPCFYHHCANITIAASTAGTGGRGGAGGTGAAGSGGRGGAAGGAAGRGGASGGTGGTGGTTGVAGSGGGSGPGVAGQGGGAAGVTGAAGAVAGSGGSTGVSGSGGDPTGSGGTTSSGSGGSPTGTAGSGMTPPADDSGCACAAAGQGSTAASATLLLAAAAMSRRRRRRR